MKRKFVQTEIKESQVIAEDGSHGHEGALTLGQSRIQSEMKMSQMQEKFQSEINSLLNRDSNDNSIQIDNVSQDMDDTKLSI